MADSAAKSTGRPAVTPSYPDGRMADGRRMTKGLTMKLICDRLSLSDALTMASGVVASRTPSPVLLCLKLTAKKTGSGGTLQISATDSEIGLVLTVPNVDIKEEGEALIPADKLNQIVRACDDSTVSISVDRTLATISTESSTFKVFGYEPREFPGVRKPSDRTDFEVDAGTLRRLINRTSFATARDDSRYAISGVLVDRKKTQLRLVATDGRRLAVARGTCKGGDTDITFIVPTKALNALLRLMSDPDAAVRVAREGNQVIFQVGDASSGATLVSSVDERAFPPFEDVIPKEHDRRATCDASELGGAIRRASLLTNEESKGVRMSFAQKQLTLTSRAPEMGESEVRIDGIAYQGEPIDIAFNPTFIVDVLKVIDSEQVIIEMKAPNKPGVIKVGNDFTYVVMPVSLQ
jgi:DNA polymerase III subunit beta